MSKRFWTLNDMIVTAVAEGLASYFGYTYLDAKGVFHPGEIGGKRVSLVKGERAAPGREASARLKEFRRGTKAFRAENGSPFTWIVSIDDPGTLYGQGAQFHYAASWLLVHFLIHGDEGRHRDGFVRYLKLEAGGEADPEIFFDEIGMSPDELDAAVVRHVKRLKTH